ncbi:MAG: SDR family NAD(P)-dependent oxidoreductase, partial [Christensenellaceae bacterium]
MNEVYTMITGATGGLGGAFVRLAVKNGENLILTGRHEEKLRLLKEKILAENTGADVRIFAVDLSDEGSREETIRQIAAEHLKIGRLINVAGADIQKAFAEYTQEKLCFQCRVNFEAAVALCRFALERRTEELEILNISSVSGLYPMPYFAIYSATKAALTAFSLALREEMKGKGVRVTAVLPGAMPTRADIREQIKGQGIWGRLAVKSPDFVAEKSLKAVSRNR